MHCVAFLFMSKTARHKAILDLLEDGPVESLGAEGVLPSVMHLAHQFVVEIRQAQNLLVVKTTVGSAQPVAAALDASHWPEVVGTLAGDDTVLVIATDKKKAQALARRINELS